MGEFIGDWVVGASFIEFRACVDWMDVYKASDSPAPDWALFEHGPAVTVQGDTFDTLKVALLCGFDLIMASLL